jgi:hypothetical protein
MGLRPCCLSSCAAQGSSRLSGANGGPTRSGPAVVGDSMADFVGSRWMSSSSSSVSGLANALLRVTLHIVLNPWSQLCCDVTGLWLSASRPIRQLISVGSPIDSSSPVYSEASSRRAATGSEAMP